MLDIRHGQAGVRHGWRVCACARLAAATARRMAQGLGLTQMKLAAVIRVTLATIANIEQARNDPSLSTAHKIADAVDLELDQVIWPLAHVANPYPSKAKRHVRPLGAAGP